MEKEENWGKAKTRNYLRKWSDRDNCQIIYGDYVDLFKHSDALVHDSGSFTLEYLCLNKPVAYTYNTSAYMSRFNNIGKQAIDLHYKIGNNFEFEEYIINVIQGNDNLENKRRDFNANTLKADGNAGARIVKHLEKIIS